MKDNAEERGAECRGCGMALEGTPYYKGGNARHPKTGNVCAVNFYGGYVCSDGCDQVSTRRQERSIDEHVRSSRHDR